MYKQSSLHAVKKVNRATVAPVSYTHLDVYKRQRQYVLQLSLGYEPEDCWYIGLQ